jgi:hypothetical protein
MAENDKVTTPPVNASTHPTGGLKGVVTLAIAISFFSTLAISIFFKIVLGQGLSAGISVVGAASFLLSIGGILLVRGSRGKR